MNIQVLQLEESNNSQNPIILLIVFVNVNIH